MGMVVRQDEKAQLPSIRELIESEQARKAITPMLPEGQTFERVMREVYNAVAENPTISQCEPASIVRAVSKAVSWDLVIGETAFLVPRKGKLCAQQGYRGKIELMVRHRAARLIDAQSVYEHERFRFWQGTSPGIEHHPIMDPKSRGALVGAYAFAKISMYEFKIVTMAAEEIDEIRKKFSMQWKGGSLEDIPWYALKTCVHRLAKQIPMTPKLARLLEDDTDDDADEIDAPSGSEAAGSAPARGDARTVAAPSVPPEPAIVHPDDLVDEREPGDDDVPELPF